MQLAKVMYFFTVMSTGAPSDMSAANPWALEKLNIRHTMSARLAFNPLIQTGTRWLSLSRVTSPIDMSIGMVLEAIIKPSLSPVQTHEPSGKGIRRLLFKYVCRW